MYELKKKIGWVFMSKYVGTGPSSYEKRIYWATLSQRLRNTGLDRPATTIRTCTVKQRTYFVLTLGIGTQICLHYTRTLRKYVG